MLGCSDCRDWTVDSSLETYIFLGRQQDAFWIWDSYKSVSGPLVQHTLSVYETQTNRPERFREADDPSVEEVNQTVAAEESNGNDVAALRDALENMATSDCWEDLLDEDESSTG
jgi:hypothetical protein